MESVIWGFIISGTWFGLGWWCRGIRELKRQGEIMRAYSSILMSNSDFRPDIESGSKDT